MFTVPIKKKFCGAVVIQMFDGFVKLSWTYFLPFKVIRDSGIDFN